MVIGNSVRFSISSKLSEACTKPVFDYIFESIDKDLWVNVRIPLTHTIKLSIDNTVTNLIKYEYR